MKSITVHPGVRLKIKHPRISQNAFEAIAMKEFEIGGDSDEFTQVKLLEDTYRGDKYEVITIRPSLCTFTVMFEDKR